MRIFAKLCCAACLGWFASAAQALDFSNSSNLIVYFSLKHNQDRPDAAQIVTNNQYVAQTLATLIKADIFELNTVEAYPENYRASTDLARRELSEQARPQLKALPDVSGYQNIILVYPNWWATYPMALATFMESVDLKGKNIIPICTHEGSRLGRSHSDLKQALPNSTVTDGLAIRGGDVFDDDLTETLQEFVSDLSK